MTLRDVLTSRPFLVVAALAIGVAIGTFGRAARVEERKLEQEHTTIAERADDHLVAKLLKNEEQLRREATTLRRQRRVRIVETSTPTGLTTKTTDILEGLELKFDVEQTKATKEAATVDHEVTKTVYIDREVIKFQERIVTVQPRWMFGGGGGPALSFAPFGVGPEYFVFGTFRFAGPFSVGLIVSFTQSILQPAVGVVGAVQLP